jgi:hypothetical protein
VQAPILATTFLFGPIGFALAVVTESALAAATSAAPDKILQPET